MTKPNLVFVFADQLRYQALGFTGNTQVKTPNLDRLSQESLNFHNTISGCPVCSPARASILTGQYPDRHGVFVNDVNLHDDGHTLAHILKGEGYQTAYIGKWHLDGHGRSAYIPPERRHGFDYWKVLECTHDYNHSPYYADDDPEQRIWEGYDVFAQTDDACRYIREHSGGNPFLLMLSWGTPHNPYETAPERFRQMYDPMEIELRENVPAEAAEQARHDLAGYYAHISALDESVGHLLETLEETGAVEDTVFVFWSDHGDMIGSQGQQRKQRPWEESIHVPLLVRYPARFGSQGVEIDALINTPDILPTLLSLCGAPVPASVDGRNYAPYLYATDLNGLTGVPPADAVLIACYHPFGEFTRSNGGVEYRGIRTQRHTYARTLGGPWLLYDNQLDPYQLNNLIGTDPELEQALENRLRALLLELGDAFLHGDTYVERWGYLVDENGTVPYTL